MLCTTITTAGIYLIYRKMHGVSGCSFCDIVTNKKDQHLATSDKCVVIKDKSPKAPHHYLVLSRAHINKPTDLTYADVDLIKEMETAGREVLRVELKAKGEADTVEDMLRIGFHWPPMVRVNHLHMHVLYPVKDLGFFSKMLVFKPGKVFKESGKLIQELEEKSGRRPSDQVHDVDPNNPAKNDVYEALPAHAIAN
ncbi:unnamed protein product, partial [Mesorhabditis spiculigera]